MELCVIGLGQMGSTLIQAILEEEIFAEEEIIGCDAHLDEIDTDSIGEIKTTPDNRHGAEKADIILLAVKPGQVMEVLEDIEDLVTEKLIISIAAGIKIARIRKNISNSVRTVRVMPNTPALVKAGVSALSFSYNCTKNDKELVREIFCGVGEIVEVEEKLMDVITGLSGSGPAYVYTMIDALADGGVLKGLPREEAQKLAAATVFGAAKMVLETDKHPAQLKDMVTSPGGTTIAGLEELESGGFRSILMRTVKKASERSEKLGD